VKAYVVGGAVRDELLGLSLQDKDYVVVGATPDEMIARGFRPVGKDFPVFLHPRTHEEYALARTERKSGRGYKGFTVYAAPEVTLEEDLRRRDLTINAMARDESGALIDPFGGSKDLAEGVLRHVSEAFAEDPVRILRVARFAARFGFRVHPDTLALMQRMVADGEADYLVPERVWQEFAKGLAEAYPQKMFDVLEACGLYGKLFPELTALPPSYSGPLAERFARLAWPLDEKQALALSERLKAPGEMRDLAVLAAVLRPALRAAAKASPKDLLEILKRGDAFRRAERFRQLLRVAKAAEPDVDTARVERALAAAAAVDAGRIAAGAPPAEIAKRIDEARAQAIALIA
jgi:tRNA nucleotidyltransferase (CCA-adding enzyme)